MRNPNPPRIPPTGFFGLETVPRLGDGAASLRRMDEVERSLGVLVFVRWTRFRARKRQRDVEAIVVVQVFWLGVSRKSRHTTAGVRDFGRRCLRNERTTTAVKTARESARNSRWPMHARYPSKSHPRQVLLPPQTSKGMLYRRLPRQSCSLTVRTLHLHFVVGRRRWRLAMQGLPASIDVERFTEVRLFHPLRVAVTNVRPGACIRDRCNAKSNKGSWACHQTIPNNSLLTIFSSQSSTHRAWQTLPRHLRRRAASHDVRRVPTRLRDKARAEVSLSGSLVPHICTILQMDANKRRLLGRPKRGKANQVTRAEDFLKRQREFCWIPSPCISSSHHTISGDKSWLETHIWHAKRAKMQNLWGYRLVRLVRRLNVHQWMNPLLRL